jgi:nicotinamidase-related amidase
MEDILESLPERDRRVIKESGYDENGASSWDSRSVGDSPAVIVVDMQRFIIGEEKSIFDSIQHHQLAIGEKAWEALDPIESALNTARTSDVPIMYTRIVPEETNLSEDDLKIVDQISPEPSDPVIEKTYTSSFFRTDLATRLFRHGIDTVVIVGNVTSGCIRATAIDAIQYGFNVVLPRDCVFDRIEISHRIALLEIWLKYGSVASCEQVKEYLQDPAGGIPT